MGLRFHTGLRFRMGLRFHAGLRFCTGLRFRMVFGLRFRGLRFRYYTLMLLGFKSVNANESCK